MRRLLAIALALAALAGCGGGHRTTPAPPAPRVGPPAETAGADWPTYHGNLERTGAVASGPAAPARRLWSAPVGGSVYAQPLVAGGRVIVATENDTLEAFDTTGRTLWVARLGKPVAGSDLPCGNIDPSGITSTPVVSGGTVYAVTLEAPPHHTLVAVDVTSGRVRWRRAVDPSGADPAFQQQRAALAAANGRIYVAYGGLFGDCGTYHGWVVAVDPGHPAGPLASYRVPASNKAGIWAPSGPAVDRAGRLYIATGNGVSSSFDFGNALIRLSPSLSRTGFFAPTDAARLNGPDVDLGSIGPLLLPGGRVFVAGKDGVGYIAASGRLGGIGGQLVTRRVCAGAGAFGGAATAAGTIYVPCQSGVVAVRASDLAPVWRGPSFAPGAPILAGRVVWAVDTDAGALYALDARSGVVISHTSIGQAAHFAAPAVAAGRLYVAAGGRLTAFG